MASKVKLDVPASWFAGGWLPPVCVKTGRPTSDARKANADWMSPAAYSGLVFGVLGFLVVNAITRKRVTGVVPYAGGGQRARNLTRSGFIVLGLSLAAMFALLSQNAAVQMFGLVGFIGIFVSFGLLIAGAASVVGVKLSKDQQWVTFKKVHPDFAAATSALLAQATAAAQPRIDPTGPPVMAGGHDPFAPTR